MGYLADAALRTMSQSGVAIRRDLLSLSCMALARPSTASAVASPPAPPRREGDRQAAGNAAMSAAGGEKRKTLEKWAFRGVCPSSFLQ